MKRQLKKYSIFTLFVLIALIKINSVSAQNTIYNINWKKDGWLIGGSMATLGVGYILNTKAEKVTIEDLNKLNKNDVNAFDRSAINNYSKAAHNASNVLVFTALAISATTYLNKKGRAEKLAIPVMAFESCALTIGITSILKESVKRYRPYTYNTSLTTAERTKSSARKSFPSGHTGSAAVATFFTAKVLTDLYPNMKGKPLIWTAAATIPAVTGLMRYKAGKHFPTDVIGGYIIGASIGYLIPAIHKSKNVSLGVNPMGGMDLMVKF